MSLTALAFLATYGAGLIAALAVNPRWGLYTYLAVFYLHPPMRWWGEGLPELRWSFITAIVTAIAILNSKPDDRYVPWLSSPLPKLMLLYAVWMWIQTAWANPMHLDGAILFTKYILLFFLVYRLTQTIDDLKYFAFAHVLGAAYFGWLTLDASGTGRLERIGGPGVSDSNTLGMHIATAILVGGALVFATRDWMRWATLFCAPLIANCFVQTESRGAFVGAICGALAFYYFAPKVRKRHIAVIGTLCVLALIARAPGEYWERISTISAVTSEEKEADASTSSRMVIAKAQLRMFANYPLGLGHRTTAFLSRQYLDPVWLTVQPGLDAALYGSRSSHATIMSVIVDQGVPGFIIGGIGSLVVLFMMWKMRRAVKDDERGELSLFRAAICGTLVTVFVAGLATNYFKAEVQIWGIGLLLAVYRMSMAVKSKTQDASARTPDVGNPVGAGALPVRSADFVRK